MIAEIQKVITQLLLEYSRIRGVTLGATKPARLPIIFMLPESEPAYLPPTSMHAPQAPGIARSLEKLARPIESMASKGSLIWTETSNSTAALANPMNAMARRVFAVLPRNRAI